MASAPYLQVEGLWKAFGGLQAVKDVRFGVVKGAITSLIGPNGAGKTTVFDLISGFLIPDRGRIIFRGRDLTGFRPHEIVSLGIARTFQHLGLFYQLSVWDNVFLALPAKRREQLWAVFLPRRAVREEEGLLVDRTAEILEFLGLGDKASEQVANLSWGDQKLVSIGRLLATDSEFLLMDEPAAGLSDEQIVHLKSLLKGLVARGKTVLLIDHNMEAILDISDWVIVLNFGQILAAGKPAEILANEDVVRVYLGV
ncbi:MAG: ABC transporter ATP-binding protein [Candidatus Rokubacteria bacterium]|nr:ABC transporter ATP-binding protein [Candidatus Rokubacteria bacterium]